MPEQKIADQFIHIIDELERFSVMGQRDGLEECNIPFESIVHPHRPHRSNTVSLDYFRMVRLSLLQEMLGGLPARRLYAAGERLGRRIPVTMLENIKARFEAMGFGSVDMGKVEPHISGERRLTVRVEESAVSYGVNAGVPLCSFEAGFLAGMLEELFHCMVVVRENACVACGSPYCQFSAEIFDVPERRRSAETVDETGEDQYSQENRELLSTLAAHAASALESTMVYERTRRMVIMDPLTGVYNYGYFRVRLSEEMHRAERQKTAFSLVMMDIDYFKEINDSLGHPAGDALLKDTARILKEKVRNIDSVCRYGGDEFSLILPHAGRNEAVRIVERIRTAIARPPALHGETSVSASFGGAVFPGDSSYGEQLIERADKALYDAKRTGRDKLVFYGEAQNSIS